MSKLHKVSVTPLPAWLDCARLLGSPPATSEPCGGGKLTVTLLLSTDEAADVAARLRGLGFDGERMVVAVEPALGRATVRAGRLREARARRDTTVGFVEREARASGEGRYSLTPEALARRMGQAAQGRSVVDAGCGSGGNAIGFARAGSLVTAIECDAGRLEEARHNARIYGVEERIRFVHGDARELVPALRAEILFVDPPWGEAYDKVRVPLAALPLLTELLPHAGGFAELWAKLPPSFVTRELAPCRLDAFFGEAAGDHGRVKFVLARRPGSGAAPDEQ